MIRLRCLTTVLLASSSGCWPAEKPPVHPPESAAATSVVTESNADGQSSTAQMHRVHFTDRAAEFHVEFTYRNGEEGNALAMLETVGGGAGLLDYDQDGRLDFFFPGGGSLTADARVSGLPGALFRQIAPNEFANVAAAAGVNADQHYTHGVSIADCDNDGFPDLLVTGYQGLQFFRNRGDGTFEACAEASGLHDRLWSSSAGWGDLNEDGSPDLVVAHYVDWSPQNNPRCEHARPGVFDICPPKDFGPLPLTVYWSKNDGNYEEFTFEDGEQKLGKGLGVLLADMDLDGHLDVYVANDGTPCMLFRNEGQGRFQDVSAASGASLNERGMPNGSMGVDLGDYNLDGLPDIWVSNYERESFALYRGLGGGLFRNVNQSTGITAVGSRYVSWGTVFFDADCDGDEDVLVVNGHVMRFPAYSPVRQLPLLFENEVGQRFIEIGASAGEWTTTPHAARGCASGDIDQDGDLDVVVSIVNAPCAVLVNDTPLEDRHWLELKLVGTRSCRDATGAWAAVITDQGRQIRQVKGGGSYASSLAPCLHFGLGTADRVRELEIHWPSGTVQKIENMTVDRRHLFVEPIESAEGVPQ